MDVSTMKVLNRTLSNTATHVESDQSGVVTEQWGDVSISYNAYTKYDEVEIPVQSEVDKKLYEERENARPTHLRLDPSINDELAAIEQYYIENHLGPYEFPFEGHATVVIGNSQATVQENEPDMSQEEQLLENPEEVENLEEPNSEENPEEGEK